MDVCVLRVRGCVCVRTRARVREKNEGGLQPGCLRLDEPTKILPFLALTPPKTLAHLIFSQRDHGHQWSEQQQLWRPSGRRGFCAHVPVLPDNTETHGTTESSPDGNHNPDDRLAVGDPTGAVTDVSGDHCFDCLLVAVIDRILRPGRGD